MDTAYNWSNRLMPNRQETMVRISTRLDALCEEGFSLDQAVDLLVGSDGEDLDTVRDVVTIKSSGTRRESGKAPAKKIPGNYEDVRSKVEAFVLSNPIADVLSVFSGVGRNDRHSMMRLSDRQRNDLEAKLRCVASGTIPNAIDDVHAAVQPYVSNSILETQLLSRRAEDEGRFKFAESGDGRIKVKDGSEVYIVDPTNVTCTCSRYVLAGFNHIGLACEHIVEACRKFDPTVREEAYKRVYAKNRDGKRYGWCDRFSGEVDVAFACKSAECPFYHGEDGGDVRCGYGTGH